jgi:hypothetical protein
MTDVGSAWVGEEPPTQAVKADRHSFGDQERRK